MGRGDAEARRRRKRYVCPRASGLPRGLPLSLDPTTLLASLAAIIGLGYAGSLLFERTRFPDILLLVGLGAALGPVLGVLQPGTFAAIAPAFGAFALLVILFDGGLSLRFHDFLHGMARAGLLAVLGWGLTVAAVGGVLFYGYGWELPRALLLGAILGGSSSVVVIPLVQKLRVRDDVRVVLSVESALTDVLCVVGALALMEMATSGNAEVQGFLSDVAAKFSVALVVGTAAGLGWGAAWRALERGPYAYMVTLAAVLLLHVGVETLDGSGPIAVLAFGVLLGNKRSIFKGRASGAWEMGGEMRRFHGEVAFFIRAFFFVGLGILLDLAILGDQSFLLLTAALVGAILAARAFAVGVATAGSKRLAGSRRLLVLMVPRGLAAAVLAGLPAQVGIPGTALFPSYAFGAIVLTNVVVTLGALASRPRAAAEVAQAPAAERA